MGGNSQYDSCKAAAQRKNLLQNYTRVRNSICAAAPRLLRCPALTTRRYKDVSGPAKISLFWSSPSIIKEIIPPSQLCVLIVLPRPHILSNIFNGTTKSQYSAVHLQLLSTQRPPVLPLLWHSVRVCHAQPPVQSARSL